MNNRSVKAFVLVALGVLSARPAFSVEEDYKLVIRDHRFEPAEMTVPARKKFKVLVENLDASAEEFESYDLNREKLISGHGKGTVILGPLKPGRYRFFGDFNPKTAQGVLVAAE